MASNQHRHLVPLLIFLLVSVEKACSATSEADALIKWLKSLSHYPSDLSSWRDSINPAGVCEWKGIRCSSSGAISEINVSNLGLNGTLNHFNFSAFPNLISLNISSNYLNGTIPSTIGSLAKLAYLNPSNNLLNGSIPHEISHLRNLRYLDVGENNLENRNWSKFVPMPFLTHLSLSRNSLRSEFPPFILASNTLLYLDLSYNSFRGPIPLALYTNLCSLEVLNLTTNLFVGSISSSIGHLKNLRNLDLSINAFNSSIPPELGLCTNLTSLSLASNPFSGELQGNHFNGEVPPEISHLYQLNTLDISSNSLSGSIPWEFTNLTSLLELNMSHNNLSGTIPSDLSSLARLEIIDLSYNNLTGEVPGGNFQDGIYRPGNPDLCKITLGLPSPKTRSSSKKTKIITSVTFPVACILFLATSIAVILSCRNKETTSKENNMSEVWSAEAKFKFSDIVEATEDFTIRNTT